MTNKINEYKVGFYVLFVVLIIFAGVDFLSSAKDQENLSGCDPCNYLQSSPSWLHNDTLIATGYIPNITSESLINQNITFVYREGCGWCGKQIEGFGELGFKELEMVGLTLKC